MEEIYLYGYVALKLSVGLAVFLLILRTSGRGSLSQMTPIDLISNFVMGGIIGGVIYNPEISVIELVIVLLIWQILIIIINVLRRHSTFFHRIVAGGDVALVLDGKYQMDEIKRLNIDMSDLATMLRIKGCSLHEVAFARLESNGDLSVIRKQDDKSSTILIKNGCVIEGALEEIGKTKTWLKQQMKKHNTKVEDIFAAEWYKEKGVNGKMRSGLFLVPDKKTT
ncbi:DUF421 domain-containing protein [Bartonella tamiae]|uniref:DUF421 domain-containing protein n=1 Tax=Bartonella tamiae Th239 TaxID=1094558 RepID=J0QX74_9HYPH|nr:YetF domain-containing protein [Bartonella tamiae]EJF90646.1 hypothetical protein ME5_01047 [Bartonella tamiae Th239]EJF93977.1 hypothetical protein MEG_00835 [Bartonella tamiae Th307]